MVFARSTEFGNIYAFHYGSDASDAVPLPERFFGGGSTSNRGFPDLQSGPRDPDTGFPVGGTALLFNQTELRFPLIGENIGGVLFHDMGNTFSSLGNISFRVHQQNLQDFNYMVHAVGFGIRYRTPVGPLRVDLAYSINPAEVLRIPGNGTATGQRRREPVRHSGQLHANRHQPFSILLLHWTNVLRQPGSIAGPLGAGRRMPTSSTASRFRWVTM